MIDVDELFAWISIGAAAGLAGMIWPFRRGVAGVVINLVVGPAGGVLAALIAASFWPQGLARTRLFAAAVGALVALALVHGLWSLGLRSRRDASHPARE